MRHVRELIYRIKPLPVLERLGASIHRGVCYSDHATNWKAKEVGGSFSRKESFASPGPQAHLNSYSKVLASEERAFSLKTAGVCS